MFLTLGSSSNTDKTADDLVEQVAADMMKEAWLLCFDEFQVTHISTSASENLLSGRKRLCVLGLFEAPIFFVEQNSRSER